MLKNSFIKYTLYLKHTCKSCPVTKYCISCPAFSRLAIWSVIFTSCVFSAVPHVRACVRVIEARGKPVREHRRLHSAERSL